MTVKIIEFIPPSPADLISQKVQIEMLRLKNTERLHDHQFSIEALIKYADSLEQNAIDLVDDKDAELQPVIYCLTDMTAKIRFYLSNCNTESTVSK